LTLDASASGTSAGVSFSAVSNTTYTVQYSDKVTAPWQKFSDILAVSSNRVAIVIDGTWTTNRFYRLVTPRQP
jgi:hypothetical protein